MKLWHDDIRRPPDESWTWARTNAAAKDLLRSSIPITEASLDHDLGLHDLDPAMIYKADILVGESSETGLDLVLWMVEVDCIPPLVRVHSWNPPGADRMIAELWKAGCEAYYLPFGQHPDDLKNRPKNSLF